MCGSVLEANFDGLEEEIPKKKRKSKRSTRTSRSLEKKTREEEPKIEKDFDINEPAGSE